MSHSYDRVPGLNQALTEHDLDRSRAIYNALPDDSKQPHVDDRHLRSLRQIFKAHEVENTFGVHLIHGHFSIPENHALLGEIFVQPFCRWARTVPKTDVDFSKVHGHIFVYNDDGLHPYEYQRGMPPDGIGRVGAAFFSAFIDYLRENKLESLLGLETLYPEFKNRVLSEIVMDGQTSMWDLNVLKKHKPSTTTGWSFSGESRECTAGETHAVLDDGSHQKYNEGSPHPKLESLLDLCRKFVDDGVLDNGILVGEPWE
ncbi:hypothetical protein EDB80DRAFT_738497 [Ilyonectria destructans]|nr:hypothetical protein EDB80DRAFT_738497 [Ilyonectria destructans]